MSPSPEEIEAEALVTGFLNLVADDQLDAAADLLADDIAYTNVSLPTIRGRERVRKIAKAALGPDAVGFEVYFHNSAASGSVVLNERTDAITVGPLRIQFWVYGRFEVSDGRITVWRDSFDWLRIMAATGRGALGVFAPALRAKPPVV